MTWELIALIAILMAYLSFWRYVERKYPETVEVVYWKLRITARKASDVERIFQLLHSDPLTESLASSSTPGERPEQPDAEQGGGVANKE